MKQLDPRLSEICKQSRITEFLVSKGVEVLKSGIRWRCKCPLGTHVDKDPSFYIKTMPDGAEVFKCFGCDVAGNIITIMSIMEKKGKGQVVKDLSARLGISLTQFNFGVPLEPLTDEIDEAFCDEQILTMQIGRVVIPFLQQHPSPDAVNKISRLYKQLDAMVYKGDVKGVYEYRDKIYKAIDEYTVDVEPPKNG